LPGDIEFRQIVAPHDNSLFKTGFVALVYFLSLLSLISIGLLSVSLFMPGYVALGAVVSAGISASVIRKRSVRTRLRWPEWALLALVALTVSLRAKPATYLNGGQDPGVYSAMGIHFARTGALHLSDSLLPDLSEDQEIRSYYLKRSMHRLVEKRPGRWVGNMVPGTYLSDLTHNQWNFQFYALHPLWLAIGNWLFGLHAQSWVLVFFSTLTVVSVYFLTRRITGSDCGGLCAAFLLAVNPGHAYVATFPVSETVAGFFFLAALYLLFEKRFFGFLVPLAALFLTRITGFITAPLLLVSLAWMAARRRDPRPLWAGFGVLGVYALSFYWGLEFSPQYSFDIYKSKLGIDRGDLQHAGKVLMGTCVVWAVVGYLIMRQRVGLRGVFLWLSRYRYVVSGCIVTVVIAACAYRGYLLGFTDHYQHHRWFSTRWNMAGHGWASLSYLSTNTLRLLLSTTGLVAFVAGLFLVGASACRRSTLAPLAILAAGFSCVFLIGQFTTPVTYYFARYLVSELVPLAVICAVFLLEIARRALPRGKWVVCPLYGVCVLFSVWQPLLGRMSAAEGEGLSRAVACINEIVGSKSVLLVDRQKLPLGAYSYTTPLRLGFGKRTYTVLFKDFATQPAKLDSLVSYFRRRGLEVFLLSSNPQWNGRSQFLHARTLHITQKRLLARGRLPTRFTKRIRSVRLYAQRPIEPVPAVCELSTNESV